MSAHTPGPWLWEYRRGGEGQYNMEVFSLTHGVIATCAWTPRPLGNGVTSTYRDANASLIAAAPELLESLRELAELAVRQFGMPPPGADGPLQKALAAIAKADGDTTWTA